MAKPHKGITVETHAGWKAAQQSAGLLTQDATGYYRIIDEVR
jgi:hypothetical protein